jgi:hypothetical protein
MSRHAGASHRALTVRGSAKARMHYVQGSVAKRAGQESAGVATLSQRAGAASEAAEAAPAVSGRSLWCPPRMPVHVAVTLHTACLAMCNVMWLQKRA